MQCAKARTALLVCLLSTASALVAEAAMAQPASAASTRVVLVHRDDSAPTEALARLRGELSAAGFDVQTQSLEAISPESLEAAAQRRDALASLGIVEREGATRVDLWVVDQLTKKTVTRSVDVSDVEPDQVPKALAIRAVELLRASLLEATMPPASEEAPEKPPPAVEKLAAAPTKEEPPLGIEVDVGLGVLASVDALGVAVGPTLRVGGMVSGPVGLRGRWLGPAFAASADGDFGTADVRQELGQLEVIVRPWRDSWFQPEAWVGGGFFHLQASGDLAPPAQGQTDDVGSGMVAAGLGLRARLSRFHVALDGGAFVTTARTGVTVASKPVGSAGGPSISGSVLAGGTF